MFGLDAAHTPVFVQDSSDPAARTHVGTRVVGCLHQQRIEGQSAHTQPRCGEFWWIAGCIDPDILADQTEPVQENRPPPITRSSTPISSRI